MKANAWSDMLRLGIADAAEQKLAWQALRTLEVISRGDKCVIRTLVEQMDQLRSGGGTGDEATAADHCESVITACDGKVS